MAAIEFSGVSFSYPSEAGQQRALDDIDVNIDAGEVVLLTGASGSGKSTLARCVNGLVPHSTGGSFRGEVKVFGRSTLNNKPRDLADTIGFISQDPEAQFVADNVETDIAFASENLGIDAASMRCRMEEVLDVLGVEGLRGRSPSSLSGGEQQRVAIAGALMAAPRVLVLDEPTSQLDPQGAQDVFSALDRLNADLGITLLISEHRLERAGPIADRVIEMDKGQIRKSGFARSVLADYGGAAPITHLGRLLGWQPPPLSVGEARKFIAANSGTALQDIDFDNVASTRGVNAATGETLAKLDEVNVALDHRPVLRKLSFEVKSGEIVCLFGRNGSGKTTLLRTMAGLVNVRSGVRQVFDTVGYVPQNPNSLLFAPTVREELLQTLKLIGSKDVARVSYWLETLGLSGAADAFPRSLSAGERQRVAIAAIAVAKPGVLLLDEPTRGMDYASKMVLENAVVDHAAAGGSVVLATHDVELAARISTRAVMLAGGEVIADGDPGTILKSSLFAPQVSRVLPSFMTVEEVKQAYGLSGDSRSLGASV